LKLKSIFYQKKRVEGTSLFFTGYKPQFYLRTTDVTGEISLSEGVEMVMPGDNVTINVKLITPVALEDGLRFAIREGGPTLLVLELLLK